MPAADGSTSLPEACAQQAGVGIRALFCSATPQQETDIIAHSVFGLRGIPLPPRSPTLGEPAPSAEPSDGDGPKPKRARKA